MDYDFTVPEVLTIYMHFQKEVAKLEAISNTSGVKVDTKKDIALYTSILKKLAAKHPGLLHLPG